MHGCGCGWGFVCKGREGERPKSCHFSTTQINKQVVCGLRTKYFMNVDCSDVFSPFQWHLVSGNLSVSS